MKRYKLKGFTLVELVTVIAILALLLAIAIPSYNSQVRKARRAEAKTQLLGMVQALERFNTINSTYVGFACNETNTFYDLTCPTQTATTFTVLATPTGEQLADTNCLNLGINQLGVKTVTGSGAVGDCW